MVEAALFIGTVIAGVTEFVKYIVPKVNGAVTIAVAVLVGVVVALVDAQIGVTDINVAEGIMTAFGTVGVVSLVKKAKG